MAEQQESTGYGQMDPSHTATEYATLRFVIDQALAQVRTSIPVKVVKVTNDGGMAAVGFVDVQPLVKQLDGKSNATPHGTVFGVPYVRMQGGENAVIIDPEVGDMGHLMVSDRDISSVKANKAEATPGSPGRKFSLSDGVYIGGILNKVPKQVVRFHKDGIEIVDKNSNKMEFVSEGIKINGVLFNRQGQVQGNLIVTGNLQIGGTMQAVNGGTYGGTITTTGTINGGAVKSGNIDLAGHHHTAQGANAPTSAAQA